MQAKLAQRSRCHLHLELLEDRRLLAASFGWDGPGAGSADLSYYIANTPTGLDAVQVRTAIETALKAWSDVVAVNFTPASRPGLPRSLDFSFSPIDGAGSTLAQAYFPSSSPIGGDIQFDTAERWEIGNALGSRAFDLIAVAVHEIGHALGLDHSDSEGSILAPTISPNQAFTGLSEHDVADIRGLYAMRTVNTTAGDTNSSSPTKNPGTAGRTPTSGLPTGGFRLAPPLLGLPTINDATIADLFGRLDRNSDGVLNDADLAGRVLRRVAPTTFDPNSNGQITLDEFQAGVRAGQQSAFDSADRNSDGTLTQNEVGDRLWRQIGSGDRDGSGSVSFDGFLNYQALTTFGRLDANSDGQLDGTELTERQWQKVSQLDVDGNGVVSETEFNTRPGRQSPFARLPAFRSTLPVPRFAFQPNVNFLGRIAAFFGRRS